MESAAIAPLVSAFVAAILTFWFGEVRAKRQRTEDRASQSIESERSVIAEIQQAAAQLADATGMAALVAQYKTVENPADLFNQTWFQQWQSSRRQLDISAQQVANETLKSRALAIKELAMDPSAFTIGERDSEKLSRRRDAVDEAVDRLNELAGKIYQAHYGETQPRKRWQCWRVRAATESTRERLLCYPL
jgi:hypothetical protein